ncbi:MAG: flippase-like domain-containing protein [Planctomycetes bacterium]|nr:flippase-like domain-containing protein [Planctomycetota bacterium]
MDKHVKQKIKFAAKVSSLIIILLISAYFFRQHSDELRKVMRLSSGQFTVISLLLTANFLVDGLAFRALLTAFQIKLNFSEWFGLTMLSRVGNYLLFRSGLALRAGYLKKFHRLELKNFIVGLFLMSLVQAFCAALLTAGGMLYLYYVSAVFSPTVFITAAFILFSLAGLYFLPADRLPKINARLGRLAEWLYAWSAIKKNPPLIVRLLILTLASIALAVARIYFIYGLFYQPVSPLNALVMVAAGLLAGFISITPGALGIKESIMAYVARINGEDFVEAAIVASIDRIAAIIWVFAFGLVFGLYLSKRKIFNRGIKQNI